MTKYMIQFSYTESGLKGLMTEGGSKRKDATEKLLRSLDGRLLAYYFCFGEYDGVAIIDGMDNVDVAAVAMIVNASGAVKTKTTVLLDPDEIDKAVRKEGMYRAPGQ